MPIFIDLDILYSAATILLDLSANDSYIERIGKQMLRLGMFKYVFEDKLAQLIHRNTKLNTT